MAASGLDLRAVEARLFAGADGSSVDLDTDAIVEDCAALLVHVRALRTVLLEAKGVVGWFAMQREKESSRHYIELEARIASVLGAAQDGGGAGRHRQS